MGDTRPNNVLASFDVSNAFLNAELSEDVVILTQLAPELVQFGLVKASALYQCTMVSEKRLNYRKRHMTRPCRVSLPPSRVGVQLASECISSKSVVCGKDT